MSGRARKREELSSRFKKSFTRVDGDAPPLRSTTGSGPVTARRDGHFLSMFGWEHLRTGTDGPVMGRGEVSRGGGQHAVDTGDRK